MRCSVMQFYAMSRNVMRCRVQAKVNGSLIEESALLLTSSPFLQSYIRTSSSDSHCLTFLHCVFTNVSSNGLSQRMHNHIDCICVTFLQSVFSDASSKSLPKRMQSHTGCIYLTFLHCVLSNVISDFLNEQRKTPMCVFK